MTRIIRRNVRKEGQGMPDDFDWQLVMGSGDRGNVQVPGINRLAIISSENIHPIK